MDRSWNRSKPYSNIPAVHKLSESIEMFYKADQETSMYCQLLKTCCCNVRLNLATVGRNRNSRALVPNYKINMIVLLCTDAFYFSENHQEYDYKFVSCHILDDVAL